MYALSSMLCGRAPRVYLTADPHCAVMAVHVFNRRQSIFMSFRFILSNTTRLAPFPYRDMRVQGSAKVRRCKLTWITYLRQFTRTQSS